MADSKLQIYASDERPARLECTPSIEHQLQIHGTRYGMYRSGTMPGNMMGPPVWWPELAHENRRFPYTAKHWVEAMRLWVACTEVAAEKQGPLLTLALGGEARRAAEEICLMYRMYGVRDPADNSYLSGPELIGRALVSEFPENPKVQLLRVAI